jgi:hypothetical protein
MWPFPAKSQRAQPAHVLLGRSPFSGQGACVAWIVMKSAFLSLLSTVRTRLAVTQNGHLVRRNADRRRSEAVA